MTKSCLSGGGTWYACWLAVPFRLVAISVVCGVMAGLFGSAGDAVSGQKDLAAVDVEEVLAIGQAGAVSARAEKLVREKLERASFDDAVLSELAVDGELSRLCAIAEFFRFMAKENSGRLGALGDPEYVSMLAGTPSLFEGLAFSKRTHARTLDILREIWLKEEKNLEGTLLTMALGAALMPADKTPDECIKRYALFKKFHENRQLFSQFYKLQPWEMAMVFSNNRSDEELEWAQEFLKSKKKFTGVNAGIASCSFIPYRLHNKNGVSVHAGSAFYDGKEQTLPIWVEYGGVCGAVSTASCAFLAVKGIPAYTMPQPGHCAFIWKDAYGFWKIGNDITGWFWSNTERNPTPWPGPSQMADSLGKFATHGKSSESELLFRLSAYADDAGHKKQLLEKSVNLVSANVPAWGELISLHNATEPETEKIALLSRVNKIFGQNPGVLGYLASLMQTEMKKQEPWKWNALLFGNSENRDGISAYMVEFWRLMQNSVSELKDVGYRYENSRDFLEKMPELVHNKLSTGNSRALFLKEFDRAVIELEENSRIRRMLLACYEKCRESLNENSASKD